MLKNGFIQIQRSVTEWRWYKDVNTFKVFVHLLFKANYEPHEFMDITVQRGQLVTSIQHLADETGISYRSVRTALSHLKTTGEVTIETNNKYSLITVLSYDEYISDDKHTDNQPTNDRQSTDNQPTTMEERINKDNKDNKDISPKTKTQCYGEYRHVRLTDEQHRRLTEEFGKDKTAFMITRCDEYCQQSGRRYKDYYLTIRSWIRKDDEYGRIRRSNDSGKNENDYGRDNKADWEGIGDCY